MSEEELRRPMRNVALRVASPILVAAACLLLGGAARAQDGGYMRVLIPSGQMAGESTDPRYLGWIPLRQASMPSAVEIAAMADASNPPVGPKVVNKPVVIFKDRDKSSLGLLGAMTSHQHFKEVDIVIIKSPAGPTTRYKLTDATIISVRDVGTEGGLEADLEQVRLTYSRIEIVQ